MRVALTSILLVMTATAVAQTPYAGMQARQIKALSEQQISDLDAGRGMGLALAAELNGYPGPSHVLELADKLGLSPDQRNQVQGLFDSMKAEAQPLGSKLIALEADLDKLFVTRAIAPDSLKASTTAIALTQGEPRSASQVSSFYRGDPDAHPDAALRRIAGVWQRQAGAPASALMRWAPDPNGGIWSHSLILYLCRDPVATLQIRSI